MAAGCCKCDGASLCWCTLGIIEVWLGLQRSWCTIVGGGSIRATDQGRQQQISKLTDWLIRWVGSGSGHFRLGFQIYSPSLSLSQQSTGIVADHCLQHCCMQCIWKFFGVSARRHMATTLTSATCLRQKLQVNLAFGRSVCWLWTNLQRPSLMTCLCLGCTTSHCTARYATPSHCWLMRH